MRTAKALERESGEEALAEAYSFLQKVVAVIAFLLPPVVAIGDWVIDGRALRGSISHYYYGRTGGWFVGSLCALAVFLLTYEYRRRDEYDADRLLSNAAFVAALGVALFPTTSDSATADSGAEIVGTIHLLCAAALFVMLAIFSLYQFTKTGGEAKASSSWGNRAMRCVRTEGEHLNRMSAQKRQRNLVYRVCGWIIVACIVMVGISNLFHWSILFWLEAIAVWAFATSWMVKSGWLPFLRDPE